MNSRRPLQSRARSDTFFALAALATLLLNAPESLRLLLAASPLSDPASVVRELVADAVPPGTPVFFVTTGDAREASVERAMRQAVAWETMPAPVAFGTVAEIGSHQTVLVPCFDEAASAAISATGRFREGDVQAGRRLWTSASASKSHGEGPKSRNKGRGAAAMRELRGLLPLLLVVLAGVHAGGATGLFISVTLFSLLLFPTVLFGAAASPLWTWLATALVVAVAEASCASPMPRFRKWPLLVGALVAILTTRMALAHAFTSPYGLAVTGGKAKLWHVTGSLPPDFFTGAGWKLLESAYPPGCAALTMGCYASAGYCGDWLTQIIPCLFAAVTVGLLVSRAEGGWRRLWLLTFFLSPLALTICGQFYPEPILALGMLAGWDRIREDRAGGWLLVGAAGWFKNEGLVFLLAAWLAWRLADSPARARLHDLATALALPLAWHIGCRLAGASLNDYVPPWHLSSQRGLHALREILHNAFLNFRECGFAYPAALAVAALAHRHADQGVGNPRPLRAALLFALFSILSFSIIFSCSTADEAWHLANSIPRLLWTPALLLSWECTRMRPQTIRMEAA